MESGGPAPNQDDWREYQALEARIQNDSRVAYAILAASLTSSLALAGLLLVYIDPGQDLIRFLIIAALALFILKFGTVIQNRFNDTASIRIARAVQLERNLRIHSFRSFPPWYEFPGGDYFKILGEYASNSRSDGTPSSDAYFTYLGQREYERIIRGLRIRIYVSWFGYAVILALIASGIILALVNTQ
ncbi:MAG: hypothetical protein AB1793_00245 [Candidatus Thermoplasmatota archaeon]